MTEATDLFTTKAMLYYYFFSIKLFFICPVFHQILEN